MSTYYLSQNSTCEAMSVLCSAGIGPFSCLACVADIATYDGSNCIPMYSVHGFNTQTYRSALNTPDAFLSSSLVLCPSFNYQWSLQNLTVELMVPSAYALKLQAQIVTNSTT